MKKRGKGMACMFYATGSTAHANPSSAVLKINHDGTATLFVGAVDEGQGSNTVLAQIAAEELGLPLDSVRLVTADTELTPYDYGTGASRVTYIAGTAVRRAAAEVKKILLEVAAEELGVKDPENLSVSDGKVLVLDERQKSITIARAAWVSERVKGRPVVATGYYNPSTTDLDPETGQGKPYEAYIFATQVAEVEVDTETGEVEIIKLTAVHNCGQAINPLLAEGQVEGGVVMGQGYALMEELKEDKTTGKVINDSFVDYILPTAVDIPRTIEVELIEEGSEGGPFGAKGIGEPTALPTAPAILNAIYNATGVRIYDLPATPEKILLALKRAHRDEV